MNWKLWAKGILGAFIGGAANGITAMIVDPQQFNFGEGWKKLGTMALVSAIVSTAMYLKASPLPNGVPSGSKT